MNVKPRLINAICSVIVDETKLINNAYELNLIVKYYLVHYLGR